MQSPKYLLSSGFAIDNGRTSYWNESKLDKETAENSATYYELGTDIPAVPRAAEWGYSFFLDAPLGNGGYSITPQSRSRAISQLKAWVKNFYSLPDNALWESCNGHYLWQHYAAEWGCGSVGAEVGETISSTQSHIAFSRGAAKQFALPWFLQFSFWHHGYINDYTGMSVWGNASTATGGHSPSLYRRTFLAAYLGGASHFYPEAGLTIHFTSEQDADGYYRLSPMGEMTRMLHNFTKRHEDVGVNYVPFGIVVDHDHGMYSGDTEITKRLAFQAFDYTDGDTMTEQLLNLFFPGSFHTIGQDESTYMVNGPYGDTCDVLLQNASQEVLDSYPCLILSGNPALTNEETSRYISYVRQGGTLLLNTAFLPLFPAYRAAYSGISGDRIQDGEGTVIVYGPDYSLDTLDGILKEQLARLLPITVSGDAEYMVNIKDGSVIVTLINNDGYYYHRKTGEYLDTSATHSVTVTYHGSGSVRQIKELWTDTQLGSCLPNQSETTVLLKPGDVKVIEFCF